MAKSHISQVGKVHFRERKVSFQVVKAYFRETHKMNAYYQLDREAEKKLKADDHNCRS